MLSGEACRGLEPRYRYCLPETEGGRGCGIPRDPDVLRHLRQQVLDSWNCAVLRVSQCRSFQEAADDLEAHRVHSEDLRDRPASTAGAGAREMQDRLGCEATRCRMEHCADQGSYGEEGALRALLHDGQERGRARYRECCILIPGSSHWAREDALHVFTEHIELDIDPITGLPDRGTWCAHK